MTWIVEGKEFLKRSALVRGNARGDAKTMVDEYAEVHENRRPYRGASHAASLWSLREVRLMAWPRLPHFMTTSSPLKPDLGRFELRGKRFDLLKNTKNTASSPVMVTVHR